MSIYVWRNDFPVAAMAYLRSSFPLRDDLRLPSPPVSSVALEDRRLSSHFEDLRLTSSHRELRRLCAQLSLSLEERRLRLLALERLEDTGVTLVESGCPGAIGLRLPRRLRSAEFEPRMSGQDLLRSLCFRW